MNTTESLLNFNERVGTQPVCASAARRAAALLLRPGPTWRLIAQEEGGLKEAFVPYAVVVGLLPAAVGSVLTALLWGTIGAVLFMFAPPDVAPAGFASLVIADLRGFLLCTLAQLVLAKVCDWVGPSFGLRRSWVLWTRVFVYAATPVYLASVVAWIPLLGWLIQFAALIWSCVLGWQGMKTLLKQEATTPPQSLADQNQLPSGAQS